MTFVKELYQSELHFYKELQKLVELEWFKPGDTYLPKLTSGTIELQPRDIYFLLEGYNIPGYDSYTLINNITLFSEDGRFIDNIKVTYSFSDSQNNYAMVDADSETLHVILPLETKNDYDPDFEIFRYLTDSLPISKKDREYVLALIREKLTKVLSTVTKESLGVVTSSLVVALKHIIDRVLTKEEDVNCFFTVFVRTTDIFLYRKEYKKELVDNIE